MAEVVLFHHVQGLTPGVQAFADTLRRLDARRVQMQLPFVEAFALAQRGQLEDVRIVRDEHQPGLDRLAVDRDAERLPVFDQDRPCADPRERLAPPPMGFAAMHQPRIDAERHVVQKEALVRAADVDAPLRSGVERA